MDVDTGFRCCAVATSRNIITIYPLRPDSESIVALSGSKQFSFALVRSPLTLAILTMIWLGQHIKFRGTGRLRQRVIRPTPLRFCSASVGSFRTLNPPPVLWTLALFNRQSLSCSKPHRIVQYPGVPPPHAPRATIRHTLTWPMRPIARARSHAARNSSHRRRR